ncbi:MAG: FHA domain-containing protein [Thermogemmatispora sp.]|uniref:protein kinase domain-containing protein n=1 Tax=Thermogemmatispora sp. TaxID=1968838 RepID=UPI0019F316B7|nr:FHA domain-containing protein [Thermogemmatispora sp.]MBE3564665.1 FHA domain-containing protein [Thermogemmatispora sp.]
MPALREGQRFERYRVIRLLGSGVAGESYEAEDTLLLRKVVLKLLHPWAPLSDAARRQFFREMQGISQLTHRYLAPVLDYGELHGALYVARRLFSSGSLLNSDGRLWFSPPLELSAAVSYAQQLAQALQHVHHAGYLHGGLSLTNIMVLRGPNVEGASDYAPFMLADVGLAHFVRRFGRLQRPILPVTAAPEQLGGRATQASDQFALAVIVYTWIAGRPPYLGLPEEIAQAKLSESFPSLLSLNPQIPVEIEGVIRRALSVYPEDRYPSVLAFAEALQQAAPRLVAAAGQAAPGPQGEPLQGEPISLPADGKAREPASDGSQLEQTAAGQSEAVMVAGEEVHAAVQTAPDEPAEAELSEEGMSTASAEALIASPVQEAIPADAEVVTVLAGPQSDETVLAAEAGTQVADGAACDEQPATGNAGSSASLLPEPQQAAASDQNQVMAPEESEPVAESLTASDEAALPEPGLNPEPTAIEATIKQTDGHALSGSALTYFEALLQATRPPNVPAPERAREAAASAVGEPAAFAPEVAAAIIAEQKQADQPESAAVVQQTVTVELPQTSPAEVSLLEVLSGLHTRPSTAPVSASQGPQEAEVVPIAEAAQVLRGANGAQPEATHEEVSAVTDGRGEASQEGERGRTDEEPVTARIEPAPAPAEDPHGEAAPAYILVLPPTMAGRQATIVELSTPEVSIGRAGDSGILLEGDRRVSRRHAFLRRAGTELLIQDGDNTEGVFVNGQRLEQGGSRVLRSGDQLRIGDHELIVCRSRQEARQLQQERTVSTGQTDAQEASDPTASSSSSPAL